MFVTEESGFSIAPNFLLIESQNNYHDEADANKNEKNGRNGKLIVF